MTIDKDKLRALAEAATQGEWQVIEDKLPCKLGSHHVERRIFTVNDHPQLKAPYPVVNGSAALGTDEVPVHHMVSISECDAMFIAAANPAEVLALLGEIDSLRQCYGEISKDRMLYVRQASEALKKARALKAENEALRRDAERLNWLDDQYTPVTEQHSLSAPEGDLVAYRWTVEDQSASVREAIDAAMAKEQSHD